MSAGMNPCVSSLRFDRWLAGDLDQDAARALEAHVAGCADCAWRKREIEKFRAGFEVARPSLVRPVAQAVRTAAQRTGTSPRLTVIDGGPANETDSETAHEMAHGTNRDTDSRTGREPAAPDQVRAAEPALRPGALPRPAQRRMAGHRARVLLAASSTALVAAAAVLLVIARPSPDDRSGMEPDTGSGMQLGTAPGTTSAAGSDVRRKGAASVAVFIQHQGVMRPGHSGDIVHPGDALQLAYSTAEPAHLAVLGRDQAGVASIYFAGGERAAAIAPGEQVPLPSSIILDDTLGTEVLYALLCQDAVVVEPVRQALERSSAVPAVPGCQVEELRFEKRAP